MFAVPLEPRDDKVLSSLVWNPHHYSVSSPGDLLFPTIGMNRLHTLSQETDLTSSRLIKLSMVYFRLVSDRQPRASCQCFQFLATRLLLSGSVCLSLGVYKIMPKSRNRRKGTRSFTIYFTDRFGRKFFLLHCKHYREYLSKYSCSY